MLRVETRLPESARLAKGFLDRAERLTLGYEDRRRSRLRCALETGEEVALLLPRGSVLRDGDVLLARDGRVIRVKAKAELVLRVTHDHAGLQRIAYHLGNRHVPVQLGSEHLLLANDAVLADLARELGGVVEIIATPFEPEQGAYGGGHRHGHAETFAEDDTLAKLSFEVHWPDAEPGTAYTQQHARSHAARSHHQSAHAHGANTAGHEHPNDHGHPHDHDHEGDRAHERPQAQPRGQAREDAARELPVAHTAGSKAR